MSTSDATGPTLLEAAHAYRRRGWRVIQLHNVGPDGRTCTCKQGANCGSAGKHPLDNAWQKIEPYSAADIQALWEGRPKANVGLATGKASGFWVLDLDQSHGKDGVDELRKLIEANGGEWPKTYVARTGSGGWHYYFAMPDEEVANSQSRVAPGIDVRGTGGQVVAPPSVSDAGPYVVIADTELAQAPAWLLELIRKPESDTATVTAADLPKPEDMSPAEWERCNRYAGRAVDGEIARLRKLAETGWDGEPWNATTFQVACSLLELQNSPWCAYASAEADILANAPRDSAGFDDFVVRKTIDSAKAKVGVNARPVPSGRVNVEEEDDVFDNPAIRRHVSRAADPTSPGGGETPRRRVDLFGGDEGKTPLYANMATAVIDEGPVAWGRDQAFWSYDPRGVWVSDPDVVERRLIDLLENAWKNAHASNTEPVVKRRAPRLTGEPVERYMNFANGMLDWRTGELLPHDPSYHSTIQFPYDWDPDATCPQVDAFLADVMHEDYVALAWEMLGYLMLSGNPLQVAFLFYGSGGNGKGTLIRVIQEMLGGTANIATESLDDLNGNRFSAVNLFGKIANLAGDIDATYQESTANFKKLTGEDMFPGERKYGDRFQFESWAVPVFSANKIPGSADVTDGYLRRWIILHFHKKITKKVPGLSSKLISEVPGIVAKAVPALRTLMAREQFAPQGEAVKGVEEFAESIDQVRQWIASGDAIKNPEALTPTHMLYGAYRDWSERSGGGRLRQQEFAHRLSSLGYETVKAAGIQYHRGLVPNPSTAGPHGHLVPDNISSITNGTV